MESARLFLPNPRILARLVPSPLRETFVSRAHKLYQRILSSFHPGGK